MVSDNVVSVPREPGRSERVVWVDFSKGFCILMVVLLHANQEMVDLMGGSGWIAPVVAFARPFRMPDFFLIAGLFLSNVIDRPWRNYLDRKVVHFVYFYVLWVAIQFLLFGVKTALDSSGGQWSAVLPAYLMTYIQPTGSLWFIHSLATFCLLVRVTRRVPWWAVWSVAAVLQMLNIHTGWLAVDEFCRRFVYFYSGYVFASHIFAFASWAKSRRSMGVAYLLIWGVVNQYCVARGWAVLPGVGLALGYVGGAAVVVLATLLSTLTAMSWLKYVGANSIVIYLCDYVMQRIVIKLGYLRLPLDHGTLTLLLTMASVAGCLLMYWTAMRVGLTFLYRRPKALHLDPPLTNAATAITG